MAGEVAPQVTRSNLEYYETYIRDEVRKGRSESDVLGELGDPRLIARTIFDSQEAAAGNYGEERYTFNESSEDRRERFAEEASDLAGSANSLWLRVKPTLIIAGVAIVGLTVLSALFSVALKILLSPAFWVILGVWGIWRVFRK